ncbi:MAG: acetyl-CoA carboxylase, carboxyltransferase subunit beta [Brevinema sp.]
MILPSKYQLKKKLLLNKSDTDNLWFKCPDCYQIIYLEDFKITYRVCPKCNYHDRLGAHERIQLLLDKDSFIETNGSLLAEDFLEFFDGTSYYDSKLKISRQKQHLNDAVITGKGKINSKPIHIAVMDFSFMGGSMGSVVGEKITRTIEQATKEKHPVIIVCASGGARMQEGIISLMQMAKTSAALKRHSDAGLLYIPILTNPTTGGVTASFAMLGDFIIAEPKTLIGFAGPRVISQTIKQKLPEGFQKAEFLQKHGFIDMIIHRNDLKNTIYQLINYTS